MERRPFIRSGLAQAETAYRRTNTNVSRSEMTAGPRGEHHKAGPGAQVGRQAGSAPGCHRVQQSTRRTCELDAPTQIRTAKHNASWRSSAPHVSTRNNTPGGPKKTHSTPTQSIAERPVTSSGRLQVSQEANIGELSELSTGSSSQLSPTCWVPHTDTEPILPKKPESADTEPILASWLLRSTGTTPKTCPRNGAATRKIRKSQRVRPRPRMTAQDIAEALDDVETLLGKLERIMSD